MSKLHTPVHIEAAKAECVNKSELAAVIATKDSNLIAKYLAPLVQEGGALSKDAVAQKNYVNALIGSGDVAAVVLHLRALVSAGGDFEKDFGLLSRFCQALFIEGKKLEAVYHSAIFISDPQTVGKKAHIKGIGLLLASFSPDSIAIANLEKDVKAKSGDLVFRKAQEMARWLKAEHASYMAKNPTHDVLSIGQGFRASTVMTDHQIRTPKNITTAVAMGWRRDPRLPPTKTRGGFPPRAILRPKS